MRIVGSAEHHRRPRFEAGQVAGCFQAVQPRHCDVQQDQVRLQLRARVQGLLAVAGLGHHVHAVLCGQQAAQALTRQWFVIGDDYSRSSPHWIGTVTWQA